MKASTAKVGAEDFVEFSVADTGIGMDAETCSRAFEPFYTTKESGKGNGLGLATVRKIVIQHGGNIHVESEVKSGTRVVVQLPRVSAMSKSSRAPEKVRSK
jgi:signal transduction histidine kinase